MIVKFHPKGAGRGSGPVEYLLGRNYDRKDATLERDNPAEIQALIDSSPYAKKYTSGVLSFAESDLPRTIKNELMDLFEKALLPGLSRDQYSCLWVEHRDKGRLELNFVIPNVELQTGKRLQPYYDRADQPRINAWKVMINAHLKLHDPDDPINKRELVTSRNLPEKKKEVAQAITDGLLSLASCGELSNRQDVVHALKNAGFTIARQTPKSISIADPDGGKNIRLKGAIYEQNFRFGAGLREEVEAASARYRAASEERIREAREVYRRGIEIKRAENQRRHPRTYGDGFTVLSADQTRSTSTDSLDGGSVNRKPNSDLYDNRPSKHSIRPEREDRANTASTEQLGGLVNDGAREAAIRRVRDVTAAAEQAAGRIYSDLQRVAADVRDYLSGEQPVTRSGEQLELASRGLNEITPAIRDAVQRREIRRPEPDPDMDYGFSP